MIFQRGFQLLPDILFIMLGDSESYLNHFYVWRSWPTFWGCDSNNNLIFRALVVLLWHASFLCYLYEKNLYSAFDEWRVLNTSFRTIDSAIQVTCILTEFLSTCSTNKGVLKLTLIVDLSVSLLSSVRLLPHISDALLQMHTQ